MRSDLSRSTNSDSSRPSSSFYGSLGGGRETGNRREESARLGRAVRERGREGGGVGEEEEDEESSRQRHSLACVDCEVRSNKRRRASQLLCSFLCVYTRHITSLS